MSSFQEMLEDVNSRVQQYIQEECTPFNHTTRKQMNFDDRAFGVHDAYYNDEMLVIPVAEQGRANYYGGLEYVSSDCVTIVGDYVFYSAEDGRIAGHLGRADDSEDDGEEDEQVGDESQHHHANGGSIG